MIRTLLVSLGVALLAAAPRAAEACAVCTTGTEDETRGMFLWTTIVMSVLPVAAVGSLVFFVRRRMKRLAAEEALRHAAASAAARS